MLVKNSLSFKPDLLTSDIKFCLRSCNTRKKLSLKSLKFTKSVSFGVHLKTILEQGGKYSMFSGKFQK